MYKYHILENFLSEIKEKHTHVRFGVLYENSKHQFLLAYGDKEMGVIVDTDIFQKKFIQNTSYNVIEFMYKNPETKQINNTKIIIGDITSKIVEDIPIFEVKNVILQATSKHTIDFTLSCINPTYFQKSNKQYVVMFPYILQHLVKDIYSDVNQMITKIEQTHLWDYIFRYNFIHNCHDEAKIDEITFLAGINFDTNIMCNHIKIAPNAFTNLMDIINELFFEWNPNPNSLVMKMSKEPNFQANLDLYYSIMLYNKSTNIVYRFYQMIKCKFDNNLHQYIELICNIVNSLISELRTQLATNFIRSIKNTIFVVKESSKFSFEQFKYTYYTDLYDSFVKNKDSRINILRCSCAQSPEINHTIGSHDEETRFEKTPYNSFDFYPTNEELLDKKPGVYMLSMFLEIRKSFWTNFISYYYHYGKTEIFITNDIITSFNDKLITMMENTSLMAPYLDKKTNEDIRTSIIEILTSLVQKEIYIQ